MDLLSSLIDFIKGLVISSTMVIALMTGVVSSYLSPIESVSVPEPTHLSVVATSSSPVVATTTPKKIATATTTKQTSTKKVATPAVPAQKPVAPRTPLLPAEQVNTLARASIVNILCMSQSSRIGSISGSGVIIDKRGVILTNAHIGQFFLLRDYPSPNTIDCVVRTGSPATPLYRATLLYLPPAWISENASQITAEHGMGTGENDYALLLINSTTNPQGTLPSSFTSINMTGTPPDTGDSVLVAGYPAGFLDGITIEKSLYATSAFTTVGQLYTFNDESHVDLVSLGGSVVAQGGASGGAVVSTYDGQLTGLIATATTGTTTASRDLRAITIAYLNRSLIANGKGGIVGLLSTDLTQTAADFNANVAPSELQTLKNVLSK